MGFTRDSVSTVERDVPLVSVTREIQMGLGRAHEAIFEVLAGDTDVDADAQVFGNLQQAQADCRALVSGGDTESGHVEPLGNAADRDSAAVLCRGLEDYEGMTRAVLRDPVANGEGTAFDRRFDDAFQQLVDRTDALSGSLDRTITLDAVRLNRVGIAQAGSVLLIAVGVALLASRQRRIVAAKTQQLAGLAAIVQASADAIVSTSADGVVMSLNPGAERLYGCRAAEIVGRPAHVLVPADRLEEDAAVLESALRGEQMQSYETERLRKDGSRVPVAVTVSPIFDGETVQGVAVIGQDISERRKRDAELATARNDALEASRLKSEFLAVMSHEIRTPMNGVIGLNSLLLDTSLDETQRQYAEGVQGASEALLTVINDILDFSKLEAGKVDLDIVDFDPRSLVEELAALLTHSAHGKGLELLAYCRPEVPAVLVGDSGRIRQILLNLASNAVKFTTTGEVAIKVTVVAESPGQAVVRFEVRDTGIGIAPADHDRLFDSFSQADASTTRRYGGTGLGLAISRRLVDAMGGEIGLESDLGRGSTFWFSLPLPVRPESDGARPGRFPDLLPGLRVLVVDDNATNRLVLVAQLGAWGMRPEAVEDARTALDRLQQAAALGQPYDIAVLDLLMPDMDGLELAQRISADARLSSTRMIMLTSTMEVDGATLAEAGVLQWLTKPVRTSALYDRLMRLMAPDRAVSATPRLPSTASVTASQSRGRVLVVEDNAVNQLVAEGLVAKLGYEAVIVANGAEAIDALAAGPYSAVLMDCHMPVMDGFEATREIRRRESTGNRHVVIIAMTAGAMDDDRDRCLAAGMDDFITKPVDISTLDQALTRWARDGSAGTQEVAVDDRSGTGAATPTAEASS